MEELSFASRSLEEQYETGGWLFGRWEKGAWILSPTRIGSGSSLFRGVALERADADERMTTAREAGIVGMRCIGGWHVHPGGTKEPSEWDRAVALERIEGPSRMEGARDFSLSLIVTPGENGLWGRPRFNGWATSRTFGEPVTEPVNLDVATL